MTKQGNTPHEAVLAPRSRRILVVDDDPTMRLIFTKTLAMAGFEVIEAEDGWQALEIYREHLQDGYGGFDAVLLDLVMPRLSGFETFRELRRHEPQLPVLIVSGVTPEEAMKTLNDRRFLSYLKKPIKPSFLIQQLSELIAAH